LAALYKTEFALYYHHKIPITMFDNRIPWEKEIFINMLTNKIQEENEKTLLENQQIKVKHRRK